jgi:uncharacterized protein HemX
MKAMTRAKDLIDGGGSTVKDTQRQASEALQDVRKQASETLAQTRTKASGIPKKAVSAAGAVILAAGYVLYRFGQGAERTRPEDHRAGQGKVEAPKSEARPKKSAASGQAHPPKPELSRR